MPTWPQALPQVPLVGGYEETPPALTARTEMDAGPAKVRRRFTAGVRLVTMRFIMTQEQLAALDAFFMDDLQAGALSFDFPAPRGPGTVVMRFQGVPRYAPAASGTAWQVSVSLEQLP